MRTITADDLKTIISKHAEWLVDRLNGARADLRDTDLHGADLRYANLSDTDLSDANLSGADLHGAVYATGWKIVRV
jgi:uncharacterized protein YjbI with pentapeptide repeats